MAKGRREEVQQANMTFLLLLFASESLLLELIIDYYFYIYLLFFCERQCTWPLTCQSRGYHVPDVSFASSKM